MKTPLHLNIGMTTNDGGHVSANSALRLVTALGSILAAKVVKGDAEDCLAVSVLLPDAREWQTIVRGIACILRQDCIAVHDGAFGTLIGPEAAKWRPFNPSAFIHPTTGLPLEVAPRVLPESDCQARQREAREKLASVESDCQRYQRETMERIPGILRKNHADASSKIGKLVIERIAKDLGIIL